LPSDGNPFCGLRETRHGNLLSSGRINRCIPWEEEYVYLRLMIFAHFCLSTPFLPEGEFFFHTSKKTAYGRFSPVRQGRFHRRLVGFIPAISRWLPARALPFRACPGGKRPHSTHVQAETFGMTFFWRPPDPGEVCPPWSGRQDRGWNWPLPFPEGQVVVVVLPGCPGAGGPCGGSYVQEVGIQLGPQEDVRSGGAGVT
jgi:hypothetical protein